MGTNKDTDPSYKLYLEYIKDPSKFQEEKRYTTRSIFRKREGWRRRNMEARNTTTYECVGVPPKKRRGSKKCILDESDKAYLRYLNLDSSSHGRIRHSIQGSLQSAKNKRRSRNCVTDQSCKAYLRYLDIGCDTRDDFPNDTRHSPKSKDVKAWRKSNQGYVDPSLRNFLEHSKVDGKSYVLEVNKYDDDCPVFIKYEKEDDQSDQATSDSFGSCTKCSHNAKNSSSSDKCNLIVLSDDDSELSVSVADNKLPTRSDFFGKKEPKHSSRVPRKTKTDHGSFGFKERLEAVLEKPYDYMEYKELSEIARRRKPVDNTRVTRSRNVAYPTNKQGKSYLDHHKKLRNKIKSADRPERLRLLRGFFFWLENVGHEDSFQPWVSPGKDANQVILDYTTEET